MINLALPQPKENVIVFIRVKKRSVVFEIMYIISLFDRVNDTLNIYFLHRCLNTIFHRCLAAFALNFFSLLFHCVTWSLVSILRYQYIVNTDWFQNKFPDPIKLKVKII
jgi:hypothetical protein